MKISIKGFTLIELLVVVAIIGILATVVLASLGQARDRSRDAVVLSILSSYRSQAELNFPTGNYTGLCSSNGYSEIALYIQAQGGSIQECDADNQSYRIIANLPSSFTQSNSQTAYAVGEDGLCINSLGTAKRVVISEVIALDAPACTSAEAGTSSSLYCIECGYCYETATATWVGWENDPLCSGAPMCPYGTSCGTGIF